MTYPGGKNGAGIYQRIINHMPPHRTYIEPFLGSGAVLRHKRPAETNIGIDLSEDALRLCLELSGEVKGFYNLVCGDALGWLTWSPLPQQPFTLIYADPPYLMETRKGADLYDYEMTAEDHQRLLQTLTSLPCMVMLSGYRSALYDAALRGWERIDYQAPTRRGMVEESLWLNFPVPAELHDYSYLGEGFRERERIRRRQARWRAKLAAMDRQERLAIMEVLRSVEGGQDG